MTLPQVSNDIYQTISVVFEITNKKEKPETVIPGEVLSFTASPESPLFLQKKLNQAGRTSQRSSYSKQPDYEAFLSPQVQGSPSLPRDIRAGKQNQQEGPSFNKRTSPGSFLFSMAQDSPLLPIDIRTSRGYGNEILSHFFLRMDIQKLSLRKTPSTCSSSTSRNHCEPQW